jgi:hypothetical protein
MSLGGEIVKINHLIVEPKQCCGSGDPCFCLMDPDPNTFVIDLQDANKKVFLLFDGIFTSFFKDKKSSRSHKKVGINVFLTIFA